MAIMGRLNDDDLEVIRRDGFILKPRFFAGEEIGLIRERVLRLRPESTPHRKPSRRWILTSPSHAFRQCLKPAVREDLSALSRVARDDGFRAFSAKYYGREVQLDHIMIIQLMRLVAQ